MVAAEQTPAQPAVSGWQRGTKPAASPTHAQTAGAHRAAPLPDDGELFERIVDALEERVLAELDRRGLRGLPEVF